MPTPSKNKNEDSNKFMSRCMSDPVMKKEFPDQKQRTAVCMGKATENMSYIDAADFIMSYENSEARFQYEDPKTGEIYTYKRKGIYKKDGRTLILVKKSK